jgi:hypothetical protein
MLAHSPYSFNLSHFRCSTSFLPNTPFHSLCYPFFPLPSLLPLTLFPPFTLPPSSSNPPSQSPLFHLSPFFLPPSPLPPLTFHPSTLPLTLHPSVSPSLLPPPNFPPSLSPSLFPLCTRAVGEKESLESRLTELGTLIASMEGAARTHSQRTNRSVRVRISLYLCSCSCSPILLFFFPP